MTKKSSTPDSTDLAEKQPGDDLVPNSKGIYVGDTGEKTERLIERLNYQQVVALLDTNDTIRRIIAILVNGKRSLRTPQAFPMHDPLMQQMDRARRGVDNRGEDDFLRALSKYLTMIPAFTPQTGRADQVKALVDQVEELVLREDVGFLPVANKLLSVLNAP